MKHKNNKVLSSAALLISTALGASQAFSSGFALIENSASGQGNAFAGAGAVASDASTMWFNPAGMMRLERDHILVAGHFIKPDSSFPPITMTQQLQYKNYHRYFFGQAT